MTGHAGGATDAGRGGGASGNGGGSGGGGASDSGGGSGGGGGSGSGNGGGDDRATVGGAGDSTITRDSRAGLDSSAGLGSVRGESDGLGGREPETGSIESRRVRSWLLGAGSDAVGSGPTSRSVVSSSGGSENLRAAMPGSGTGSRLRSVGRSPLSLSSGERTAGSLLRAGGRDERTGTGSDCAKDGVVSGRRLDGGELGRNEEGLRDECSVFGAGGSDGGSTRSLSSPSGGNDNEDARGALR